MCAGYANEDYIGLLTSIEKGRTEEISGWLETILSMGHTSGADGLLGFGAAFGYINM